MTCPACESAVVAEEWTGPEGVRWRRCAACGSEAGDRPYDPAWYDSGYAAALLAAEGPDPLANHLHNADFVERHAPGLPGRTVLDVGCGAGTTLAVFRSRGWATVGWDVSAEGRPPGTVVSPTFAADLFHRPFDAVICREVIEHVADPHGLLRELAGAVAPGGVLHLTTPRPITDHTEWRVYQPFHLCVWSPEAMTAALSAVGLGGVETDLWELGQRHVCRPAA